MAGPTVVVAVDVGVVLGAGGPAHATTHHVRANAATAFRTTTCLARLSTDFQSPII